MYLVTWLFSANDNNTVLVRTSGSARRRSLLINNRELTMR